MDKKELKSQLDEVKAKIKTNSKDAHFAESLISDLLSIKGQMMIEPTRVHIEECDVEETFRGETFEMYRTKKGEAVFHTFGGLTVIADPRLISLNGTISTIVNATREGAMDDLTDEEREQFILDVSATAHLLNLPAFVFSNLDFKYEMARKALEFIRTTYEQAMEAPLQEEKPEEDRIFEDGVKAAEAVAKEMQNIKPE